MATVTLLYRSIRDEAFLNLKFQFWIGDRSSRDGKKPNGEDLSYNDYKDSYKSVQLLVKTELLITKKEWDLYLKDKGKNITDTTKVSRRNKIEDELRKLKEPILKKFAEVGPETVNKEWLQDIVADIYHPDRSLKPKIIIPTDLISFINYFVIEKVLNSVMTAKYNVLKMRLQKFQDFRKSKITFSDFNLSFAYEFSKFYKENQNFMDNTLKRDFGYIASLCIYAKRKGVEVNDDWIDFKFSKVKKTDLFPKSANGGADKIFYQYFNLKEIEKIENLEGLSESLDNVRDWLLISLFTGQRVSDFMRFDKSMLIESRGKKLIKFIQKKGNGKQMEFAINFKVQKILDKRNGDFPRKIEFQKYNDYVKKVAKKAGFTEKVMGYKDQVLEGLGKRRVYDEYERWELISSHIGRRSFATNYYKSMDIQDIMFMTGHATVAMFLLYINETPEEQAHAIDEKYSHLFK